MLAMIMEMMEMNNNIGGFTKSYSNILCKRVYD